MGLRIFSAGQAATHRLFAGAMAAAITIRRPTISSADSDPRRERGDVPGWVMITMMTAIVVIVLLGVFQEAVVNAVRNAFDSITAQGGTTTGDATGGTP